MPNSGSPFGAGPGTPQQHLAAASSSSSHLSAPAALSASSPPSSAPLPPSSSSSSSGPPTVRLAPIIKTNHAQALALEIHMIAPLSHEGGDDEGQTIYAHSNGIAAPPAATALSSSAAAAKQARPGSGIAVRQSPHVRVRRTPADGLSSPSTARKDSEEVTAGNRGERGVSDAVSPYSPSPLGITTRVLSGSSNALPSTAILYTFPTVAHEKEKSSSDAPTLTVGSVSPSGHSLQSSSQREEPPLHLLPNAVVVSPSSVSPAQLPFSPTAQQQTDCLLSPARLQHTSSDSTTTDAAELMSPSSASFASPHALNATVEPAAAAAAPLSSPSSAVSAEHSRLLVPEAARASSAAGVSLLQSPSSVTSDARSPSSSAPAAVPRKRCTLVAPSDLCSSCLPIFSSASSGADSSSASSFPSTARFKSPAVGSSYRSSSRRPRRRFVASTRSSLCSNLVTCNPCRLSFRFSLVLLCVLQVVISVGVVWYLGYSNSVDLIGELSNQLRQTALIEITGQIHDQLTRPLLAVNQLQYNYARFLPELGSLPSLSNVTGLYSDISFVIFNSPQISSCGCSTLQNQTFAAINISAYLAAGTAPARPTDGITSGFAYIFQDSGDTTATYHLPPVNPASTDPNLPLPDYNASSTVADLGAVWYTVANTVPTLRPPFLAAQAAHGDFTWSPVYQMARAANSTQYETQSIIAAAKAVMGADGQLKFACWATIFLSRMGNLLSSLSVAYGPNGLAMVLDSRGMLLSCSDPSIAALASTNATQPIYYWPDDRLAAIAVPLQAHGLFNPSPGPAAPTGDFVNGGIFYQNNPAFDAEAISIGGSAYHLQATRLNSTGLDWIIVVVTKDTDFDGDLSHHELVTGMLSMLVLVLAIVAMIVFTTCLNRPLSLVVRYMSAVAKMGKHRLPAGAGGDRAELTADGEELSPPAPLSRSAEQLRQLKLIYSKWKSAVTISIDDELELSRTSSKSAMQGRSSSVNAASDKGGDDADGTEGGGAGGGGGEDGGESTLSRQPALSRSGCWRRAIDRLAVCLMREVEDMQFTFHSMLHQLTKSTQEVENANEAKRHFVRYIFHEVRVPLNAVMLGLADLRSSCGGRGQADAVWSEEQRDVLDIVHEQSQVVGRILNDVLSLHKIEDGALTLQYSPFSLESMILSTMQSFQPGIHDKQIHYTAQLQTVQNFVFSSLSVEALAAMPQVDVVGDKYRLRQVLANFLSNAIKFTPSLGNVHVSLQILPCTPVQKTHNLRSTIPFSSNQHVIDMPQQQPLAPSSSQQPQQDDQQQQQQPALVHTSGGLTIAWPPSAPTSAVFRIAVRDSGVGVSVENQKKLFSPYMQILPGELQKGAGTGLGLSISQNLIRIHGGEIGYVTPEDGRGSEFFMEVPMQMRFRAAGAGQGQGGVGTTPNTSVRMVTDGGEEKEGSASADRDFGGGGGGGVHDDDGEDDEDGVIGALAMSDDRMEEDAIIREITDLQLLQQQRMAAAQQQQQRQGGAEEDALSKGSADFNSPSDQSVRSACTSPQCSNPLYVSRPKPTTPDSSVRILAQQRLLHAQHLRKHSVSSPLFSTSPAVLHSSRRLVSLALLPSLPAAVGDDISGAVRSGGNEDSPASGCNSSSSRSVSLIMNDAHGPVPSPLHSWKRSPLGLQRRVGGAGPSARITGQAGEEKEAAADVDLLNHRRAQQQLPDEQGGGYGGSDDDTPVTRRSQASSSTSQPLQSPLLASHIAGDSSLAAAAMRRATTGDGSSVRMDRVAAVASSTVSTPSPTRSDLFITLASYGQAGKSGLPSHSPTSGGDGGGGGANRVSSVRALTSVGSSSPPAAVNVSLSHKGSPQQPEQPYPSSAAADRETETLKPAEHGSSGTAGALLFSGSGQLGLSSSTSTLSPSVFSDSLSSLPVAAESPRSSLSSPPAPVASQADVGMPVQLQMPPSPASADSTTASNQLGTARLLSLALPPSDTSPVSVASISPASAGLSGSAEVSPLSAPGVGPGVPKLRQPGHAPSASASLAPSVSSGPVLRVLVAEDSLPNLKLLLVLLRKMRTEAVGVENGQLAVDRFRDWHERHKRGELSAPLPFDLVLMDGNMPILGGIEATRKLRAMGLTIPIYAVTGNAMAEDTADFLRAGANAPVLTKPIQQKELQKILTQHLQELKRHWKAKGGSQ